MLAALSALADLFDVLPDAVVVADRSGTIVLANAAAHDLLRYPPGSLAGKPLSDLIPVALRRRHATHFDTFHAAGRSRTMASRPVLPALDASGREIPVSIAIANFDLAGLHYSVAVMRDASLVRDRLDQAFAKAETDALTGIGNRLFLSRRTREATAQRRPFGILFVDLRRFKPVNDTFGHAVGDALLRMVAQRLQALARASDTVARIGGDEFVLLFAGLADRSQLERRATEVGDAIAKPFHVESVTAVLGATIGGAMHPEDGDDEDQLLRAADARMYRARSSGRVHCVNSHVQQ